MDITLHNDVLTPVQPDVLTSRRAARLDHSLQVCCIGDKFLPGCQESVVLAAQTYGQQTGYQFAVTVIPNLTVLPPLGLGAMRNFAIGKSKINGWKHVVLIDNDVRLDDPETFVKLLSRGVLYITPWFDQTLCPKPEGKPHKLHDPMFGPDQGALQIEWTVPYCVMFDLAICDIVGVKPYTESMIFCEDELNSLPFRAKGVSIWQDTDVHATLLRGPGLLSDTIKRGFNVVEPGKMPESYGK